MRFREFFARTGFFQCDLMQCSGRVQAVNGLIVTAGLQTKMEFFGRIVCA
jgi:hypothetical protein